MHFSRYLFLSLPMHRIPPSRFGQHLLFSLLCYCCCYFFFLLYYLVAVTQPHKHIDRFEWCVCAYAATHTTYYALARMLNLYQCTHKVYNIHVHRAQIVYNNRERMLRKFDSLAIFSCSWYFQARFGQKNYCADFETSK